jgi:hypothetical protein
MAPAVTGRRCRRRICSNFNSRSALRIRQVFLQRY